MPKTTQQGHIKHIESLRAIAAMLVMGFHFISHHNGIDHIIYNEKIRTWSEFGAQGVELFYIISGFVISYSFIRNQYVISQYFKYALKRIVRIIPTYLIAMIIALGIGTFFNVFVWKLPFEFDTLRFLSNLTFTCDLFGYEWYNEIYKTLKVEFQFYLIIGLIWPLLKKNIGKIITFAVWLTLAYFTNHEQTFLVNGPYFIIGICLCQVYLEKDKLLNWILTGVALSFIGTFYLWEDLIISLIAVLFIIFIKIKFKPLEWIGQSSYSLYLLHGAIGGWFLFWFTKDNFVHINHLLAIAIASILSILGSLVAYRIIEKPFIKLGKRIKYKS